MRKRCTYQWAHQPTPAVSQVQPGMGGAHSKVIKSTVTQGKVTVSCSSTRSVLVSA